MVYPSEKTIFIWNQNRFNLPLNVKFYSILIHPPIIFGNMRNVASALNINYNQLIMPRSETQFPCGWFLKVSAILCTAQKITGQELQCWQHRALPLQWWGYYKGRKSRFVIQLFRTALPYLKIISLVTTGFSV